MMTGPKLSTAVTKSGDLAVYLENRRAGTIITVEDGYSYVPAGQSRKSHGEIFDSINKVLKTLEG